MVEVTRETDTDQIGQAERCRTLPPQGLPGVPEGPEQAPVWLEKVLEWAHGHRVTDLHFFPSETDAALWGRVDGDLREVARYSLAIHMRLVARLKVLGRCADYSGDPVQEGRFSINKNGEGSEARLSVVPTLRGDKAVVRLLSGHVGVLALNNLGFCQTLRESLRKSMDVPQGLVLAVGPSGCGKSTALYALLDDTQKRAGHPLSIVTIEDPVEQSLSCAAQISADPARGLGFAQGLRAVLRQDPEIIMIGEIRDAETAEATLNAALTGHRLLSSMHTLTAAEALVRLRQMGSPAYVIASALAGILNVRLVKLLCPKCRIVRPANDAEKKQLPLHTDGRDETVAEAAGCPECLGSGYRGRTAIAEWILPTDQTAQALAAHENTRAIAATLKTGIAADETAIRLLRDHRVSLSEIQKLSGFVSLNLGDK